MAFKVVRSVAEYAVLFRERLQLTPLRTVPVGGMCLWQGAVTETISLSEGMLREAGKISITRGAPISLTDWHRQGNPSPWTDALVNAALCVSPEGRNLLCTCWALGYRNIHERRCFVHAAKLRINDTVAVFIPIYHANNVPGMFTWRSVLRNGVILTDWLSWFCTKIASQPSSKVTHQMHQTLTHTHTVV